MTQFNRNTGGHGSLSFWTKHAFTPNLPLPILQKFCVCLLWGVGVLHNFHTLVCLESWSTKGKLEYWKTQKLCKLGQASNNCWNLFRCTTQFYFNKFKTCLPNGGWQNGKISQCYHRPPGADIMPIDASWWKDERYLVIGGETDHQAQKMAKDWKFPATM